MYFLTPAFRCFVVTLNFIINFCFFHQVLPHIKDAGYNAIQLIGIVEHKDYSSVGYKVRIY